MKHYSALIPLNVPAIPEPEVVKSTLSKVRAKSLAQLIADLLNQHEPLLCAAADGDTVTVREKGDDGVMRVRVG